MFHLFAPPLHPSYYLFLHSHIKKNPVFFILPAKIFSSKINNSDSLPLPVNLHLDSSSTKSFISSIALLVSLHPRRRNSYRTSYRNPVTTDPSGRHTLETGTAERRQGNMQRAHFERENIVNSQSQASLCMQHQRMRKRVPKPMHAASKLEGMGSNAHA